MGEFVRRRLSKIEAYGLMLENAAQSNILSLNSTCNVWCKFCSHQQNPKEVEAFHIPAASLELTAQAISFLDRGKPVVIGESVTRIMEGEPFVHPQLTKILVMLREKMPDTPIHITTNGTMLNEEMVQFLASLGGVTICLSLNSSDPSVRKLIMQDLNAETAVKSAALLKKGTLPFHGSIVAMPHKTGWEDLARTIKYLDGCGAETVRVFAPGHTRLAPPDLKVPENLREQLDLFLAGIRRSTDAPVTLEPPLIKDLTATVAGVVAGSPARGAGLEAGDIIEKVQGRQVKSRVDAFRKVLEGSNPVLEVNRSGSRFSVQLTKEKGVSSGLVFDYDVDPAVIRDIESAVRRRRAGRAVLLASELGFPAMRMALDKMWDSEAEIEAAVVKNSFFGGSIGCAGLLTVEDMLKAIRENRGKAGLFIAPGMAFDRKGRDITGRSYLDLENECGTEIEVV